MSARRPYTRGGRRLYAVRPRPFVPPALAAQALHLLRSPAAGVALILRAVPSPGRLALGLTLSALARLAVDLAWSGGPARAIGAGDPSALLQLLALPVLWLWLSCVLHVTALWLGGTGLFRPLLQVSGVALLVWPLAGLVSLAHWWLPLPAVTWGMGRPMLGLGEGLFMVWLGAVAYRTARQVHGLSPLKAALAALPAPLAPVLIQVAAAGVALRLLPWLPGDWRPEPLQFRLRP